MQTEIESKISFENIIQNRISHFQNIYHANEAGRLTLALRAIEELIPPSHFKYPPPVEQTVDATINYSAVVCENHEYVYPIYTDTNGKRELMRPQCKNCGLLKPIEDINKTVLKEKFIELWNQITPDAGQLEKIIGDAFDAGIDYGFYSKHKQENFYWAPDKAQYIKQAIEQFNNSKK